MGYVIIKKGKRKIKIPVFLYRLKCILDNDFEFDYIKNVSEICYSGIGFNDTYFSFYKKKVIFDNCKFSDCDISLNDSILISNSEFEKCELYCNKCKSVDLTINENDSKTKFIVSNTSNIKIQGENVSDNSYSFNGNNIQVSNTIIYSKYFGIDGSFIDVTSSEIIALEDVSISYDKLCINDICFESKFGKVKFFDYINNKEVDYYKNSGSMTVISDSDILCEKNKSTYDLISILKGYKNMISNINKEELNRQKEKIDLEVSQKLGEIDSQIEALCKKQNNINNSVLEQKLLLDDKYNRRKVKTIGVRK